MNEQQIKLFKAKGSDNWGTPPPLYNKLNKEFNFDYDPCPFNNTFDGLTVTWGRRCFVNPPYSKVKEFLKKAWGEIDKGNTDIAVFLVFANTDTAYFHDYIYNKAEIRFIRGRLKFTDIDGKTLSSAMRPSIIAVLRRRAYE